MWYIYIYIILLIYIIFKKNEIMPFASTWIDLEILILSKISQTREIRISYDITYVWNLKNDTSELIYKIEIDSQT